MKKERQIKSDIDLKKGVLTISTTGKDDIVVEIKGLDKTIAQHAMLHGLKQKIVDSAALGSSYTLSEKYDAMMETFERLTLKELPSWNKRAEGGGSVTGLLFRALVRLYPDKDTIVLREYHDKLDKSQQHALRQNPKIASIIEDIKAESVKTSGVDTDALLGELDGLG